MATDFGTSVGGISDLPLRFVLVSGFQCLGQDLARRLQTPRGALPWDLNAGYDVRALLNEAFTPTSLAVAEGAIASECEKDERVLGCQASITFDGASLTINLVVDTEAGPFALVLGVDALTVAILNGPTS